jgi:hypothetical protein
MVTEQIRENGQRENPYAIQRKPRIKSRNQSEFNLTVRAKNGDPSVNLELWEKYKPVAISILKPVYYLTWEERLSEAYMLFLHKLEIFDPDKVLAVRDPDTFTFSYMMTGGLKNLKASLMVKWRTNANQISFVEFDDGIDEKSLDKTYPCIVGKDGNYRVVSERLNVERFNSSNPENIHIRESIPDSGMEKKKQLFYTKLSDFQKKGLKLREDGKTIKGTAVELHCSITKIRHHISKAKIIAAEIFGITPELSY